MTKNSAKVKQSDFVLVFIMGGLTWREVRKVREFVDKHSGKKVWIGGTNIYTRTNILERFCESSS